MHNLHFNGDTAQAFLSVLLTWLQFTFSLSFPNQLKWETHNNTTDMACETWLHDTLICHIGK